MTTHQPKTGGPLDETSPPNDVPEQEEDVQGTPPAAQRPSWDALKVQFLDRVQAEGFPTIPEPDSRAFPTFLTQLNAKNSPLARSLVAETRRLRRGMEMPSSAASRRRERKRETRRVLLMKQTADGRWVVDKQKAPMYGMLGLLLIGGLLTAIYTLPRLNAQPAFTAQTPQPSTLKMSRPTPSLTETAADQASQAALVRSREELKKIQQQNSAITAPKLSSKPSLMPPVTRPKTLTSVQNPPPPPAVVQAPSAFQPAVFSPVAETSPAPRARVISPAPRRAVSPVSPPESVTYSPPPSTTETALFGAGADSARVNEPAAPVPPAEMPLPAPASASGGVATSPLADPASSGESNPAMLAGTAPAVPTPLPASSQVPADPVPFGGYGSVSPPESQAAGNAAAVAASQPATEGSPRFVSGLVYERKSTSSEARTAMVQQTPPTDTVQAPIDAAAPPVSTGTETPFGSDTTNAASKIGATGPFKPLQQIPAALLTGLRTPNGGSVPVVATSQDGGSFVGVATVNAALARVDLLFRRYIAPDGKIYSIDALAYARENGGLVQGIPATVEAIAPTLALDAAQNSASALNTYVQNVAVAAAKGGSGTTINLGDGNTLSGPSAASLAQTLLGGLGSTFQMPQNTQSILRVASVKTNAQMVILAGLGGTP